MIGVFDSGFGGLTVLKAFLEKFPDHDFVFLGDNLRAPFGGKSQEEILEITKEGCEWLFENGCEVVILACNTASVWALRKIQQEWLPEKWNGKSVLGVVVPVAEGVIEKVGKGKKVGVIGTKATCESETWDLELMKLDPEVEVKKQVCADWVDLIEDGKADEMREVMEEDLEGMKKMDVVVLGCTHFPLVKKQVEEILGEGILVLDTPDLVAEKMEDWFGRHPEREIGRNGKRRFVTTGDAGKFQRLGSEWLGEEIREVERVELGR